jgi:hypothetical protein
MAGRLGWRMRTTEAPGIWHEAAWLTSRFLTRQG